MNAHRAMGNFMAYSVTKAAVVALTKSAAVHCGNQGYKIRVNAILPGVVETAMITNLIETSGDPAAARAAYRRHVAAQTHGDGRGNCRTGCLAGIG